MNWESECGCWSPLGILGWKADRWETKNLQGLSGGQAEGGRA
jgi:hypothetical protein